MGKENNAVKRPQPAGSLRGSPVRSRPSQEVTVDYSETPPPVPEGKEIHPRRRAPVIPQGPESEDADPSRSTVFEESA